MYIEILPWASSPSRKWPPEMEWQTLLAGQLRCVLSWVFQQFKVFKDFSTTFRQYGKRKWPFAPTKSIVGSAAFVVAGFLVSTALLALMNYTGNHRSWTGLIDVMAFMEFTRFDAVVAGWFFFFLFYRRDFSLRCSRQDLDHSGYFSVQCCRWTGARR